MHHFDEMAKALAGGLTRRQTLRRVGGSLAGAMLASLGLGKVWGVTATNCADYCKSLVGTKPGKGGGGNAYASCVSSCTNCLARGGTPCGASTCCVKTCADYCTNDVGIKPGKGSSVYGSCVSNCAKCIASGGTACGASACCDGGPTSTCCSGTCADLLTDNNNCGTCGNTCASGSTCRGGACVPTNCCTPANSFPGGPVTACGSCQDVALGSGQTTAFCWVSVSHGTFCGANYDNCGQTPTCRIDEDCPAGYYCTVDFCGTGHCRMICDCG